MKTFFSFAIIITCFTGSIKAQDTLNFTKTEVIYGRKDGMALTMLVLTPKEKGVGKAIIKVVSGNWVSSYNQAAQFAGRSINYINKGYTVFIVMHGSQPRYTIPDEITDLKRAVRFIRYNAREYHIDSNHIGITGYSSGGHLSLMVGLSDDTINMASKDPVNRVSARVQAVAVFYPPTDFLNWGKPNAVLVEARAALTLAVVAPAFEFKEWNDTTKTYQLISDPGKRLQIAKQTSPIYAVSNDDPAVLIVHGDADNVVPLQQSESMIKKLIDANVTNQLIIKKGGGHGWKNQEVEEQEFIKWFEKYLK